MRNQWLILYLDILIMTMIIMVREESTQAAVVMVCAGTAIIFNRRPVVSEYLQDFEDIENAKPL